MKVQFIIILILCSFNLLAQSYAPGDLTTPKEFNSLPLDVNVARDYITLPSKYSLKYFAPQIGDQGMFGTCTAWSCGYAAKTICYNFGHGITFPSTFSYQCFSPNYLYEFVKDHSDSSCLQGTSIIKAMSFLKTNGILNNTDSAWRCSRKFSETDRTKASLNRIKDFTRLNETFGVFSPSEIRRIKGTLALNRPVILSINYYPSLSSVRNDGIWKPSPTDIPGYRPLTAGHALCIVGYDDSLNGGSFEAMNSWGINWGNQGYFWISYNQIKSYGRCAVSMVDQDYPDIELSFKVEFSSSENENLTLRKEVVDRSKIRSLQEREADFIRFATNFPSNGNLKIKINSNAPQYIYIITLKNANGRSGFDCTDKCLMDTLKQMPGSNGNILLHNYIATLQPQPDVHLFIITSMLPIDLDDFLIYSKASNHSFFASVEDRFSKKIKPVKTGPFDPARITYITKGKSDLATCFFVDFKPAK